LKNQLDLTDFGTRIKRIAPDEFGLACEAKGGRIHAKAWAGNKVMPLFKAWGLIVFFSFKRFQRDKNRMYHVEIPFLKTHPLQKKRSAENILHGCLKPLENK